MFNEELKLHKVIKLGMVGGGRGSQIGYIHRNASSRGGLFQLVAGAFDVDYERCKDFGKNIGVEESRCYPDYKELIKNEAGKEDGIDAIIIATPNRFHYEMSKAALEANLHVICEKPLCFSVEEAEELKKLADSKNKIFGVAYGYTGYQMIHEARTMIANGDLGDIRVVRMSFAHGYHNEEVEKHVEGLKWRVTPTEAGDTYIIGDCATHILCVLDAMIPGIKMTRLLCHRQSFIESRKPLEDNAFIIMDFNNGATGECWASAVNCGSVHGQKIRIVGSKASIEWWDEHPNQLLYEVQGKPKQILDRAMPYLHSEDEWVGNDRIGSGHPEGIFESWANMYESFAKAIYTKDTGDTKYAGVWYPSAEEGIEGTKFTAYSARSADNGSIWIEC